jgi:uncharacterized protein (DUF2132 family)
MADKTTRDPLHGVTLESVLEALVKRHGWAGLGRRIPVRCFLYEPSVKSSLAFLRKTPWARKKVEDWYVRELPRHAVRPAVAETCLTSVARTLLAVLGINEGLAGTAAPADARVMKLRPAGGVKKILVYAPDAIGRRMIAVHPELFAGLDAAGFQRLDLRSVYPPKTPVCFASMFSGLPPVGHGIKQYEKPALKCNTIFDALPAHGVKTAIAAVKDSSIDLIFRGRPVDYFSEVYDAEVTARALELIEAGGHDFILAYHQEYDDLLHDIGPWKDPAVAAVKRHTESFLKLAEAFDKKWTGVPRAVLFAPDHGAHVDPATGKGTHGEDIPADMDITHFWRFGA